MMMMITVKKLSLCRTSTVYQPSLDFCHHKFKCELQIMTVTFLHYST
jgi:hypothetical protein